MFKLFAYDINDVAWELDLPSDFKISLNFTLFDFQDITSKNRIYSNTISLPSSYNNDRFFMDAYDYKSQLFYNHKNSIKCYLTDDVGNYIEGKMYIVESTKTKNKYEYKINIVGNNTDVFSSLGNTTLRDVLNSYTYQINNNNYINGFTSSLLDIALVPIDNGEKYDVISNGPNFLMDIYSNSLYPAVRLNWLVEKIINYAGYSIDSNSIIYDSVYYPYFKYIYLIGDEYNRFENSSQEYYIGWKSSNITNSTTGSGVTAQFHYFNSDSTNFNLDYEELDNGNIHDITNNKFNLNGQYNIKQNYNCSVSFEFLCASNLSVGTILTDWFKFWSRIDFNGTSNSIPISKSISPKVNSATNISPGVYKIQASVDFNLNSINTKIFNSFNDLILFTFFIETNNSNFISWTGNHTFTINPTSRLEINKVGVVYGSSTNYDLKYIFKESHLASDILKEFLRSFNLLLSYEGKKIKIQNFSNFFDTTNFIDGDEIIDNSYKRVILNNQYQSKTINIKWADRNDLYCKDHKDKSGVGYGDRVYNTSNEFSNNSSTIQTKFSTIPIVYDSLTQSMFTNVMFNYKDGKKEINKEYGLRLVCYNGSRSDVGVYIDGDSTLHDYQIYHHLFLNQDAATWPDIYYLFSGSSSYYFDLNYSFPYIVYWQAGSAVYTTNNNIFRDHFQEYVDVYNSDDTRILQCKMYIGSDLKDILTHKKLVYYDGSYWIVNKINGFKGFGYVYEVEMIKKILVELPEISVGVDNGNINGNDNNINRFLNISNDDNGLNLIANDISTNRLILNGSEILNYTNKIYYDVSYGNKIFDYDDILISSVGIIITQLPDSDIVISLNGQVLETINPSTSYTMKNIIQTYTTTSTSSSLEIDKTTSRYGNFILIINYTKLY